MAEVTSGVLVVIVLSPEEAAALTDALGEISDEHRSGVASLIESLGVCG